MPVQIEHGVNIWVQGWGRVSQARCLPSKVLSELNTLHIYVHWVLVDFSCPCCALLRCLRGCQVTWCWGAILCGSSELLTSCRQRPSHCSTPGSFQDICTVNSLEQTELFQSKGNCTYRPLWRIQAPRLWRKPTSWALEDRRGAWAASTLQTITFSGSDLAGLGLLLAPRKWHRLTCKETQSRPH